MDTEGALDLRVVRVDGIKGLIRVSPIYLIIKVDGFEDARMLIDTSDLSHFESYTVEGISAIKLEHLDGPIKESIALTIRKDYFEECKRKIDKDRGSDLKSIDKHLEKIADKLDKLEKICGRL